MGCLGSEVEYAVIPTELDESADVHGDDLSDAAKQCRFRALVVSFLLALGQHGKLQNLQNCRTLKGSYLVQTILFFC